MTSGGFVGLFGSPVPRPRIVTIDRATFDASGATWATLPDEEPMGPAYAHAIAAMGGGYAVYYAGPTEAASRIRLFDPSGDAFEGDIALPAGVTIGGSIHTAAGSLTLSFREGDGPWGWLEATCGE